MPPGRAGQRRAEFVLQIIILSTIRCVYHCIEVGETKSNYLKLWLVFGYF
jgi:hypothetical protein